MFYPLTSDTWNHNEIKAINKVIKSKQFTMGKEVKNFEKNYRNIIIYLFSIH